MNESKSLIELNGLSATSQAKQAPPKRTLYSLDEDRSSCGVGFLTDKTGAQTHKLMEMGDEALCTIPHRGGMSSRGIGDGAGINIDLSLKFFRKVTGIQTLEKGEFGVGNFFLPRHEATHPRVKRIIEEKLEQFHFPIYKWRNVPVNPTIFKQNPAAGPAQYPMLQVIFGTSPLVEDQEEGFEKRINDTLLEIETLGYSDPQLKGFYPLSMSSRTLVYKGRLNSNEIIGYFEDLCDPDHEISMFLFHTRFSTNTRPAAFMAQPFRRIAHNGELNTDRKNRLSEDAIARLIDKKIIFPPGQSDSSRLDQTLARRILGDKLDIVEAVVAMMPPAWENDKTLSPEIRSMFEFYSLYEEKYDGPAALIFSDGVKIGARLDRLGLRPLRSVETDRYLAVTSEAGQITFAPQDVIRRGRIEAGGILYYDHAQKKVYDNHACLEELSKKRDFAELVKQHSVHISSLEKPSLAELSNDHPLTLDQRYVAYGMNQESFKFFLDPMMDTGLEKVSAMGFGVATNAMTKNEGGMSKYFSQRFAQVTNPPLDSLRELDGMTLRVSLGPKPIYMPGHTKQIVIESPVLQRTQLEQLRRQEIVKQTTIKTLYDPAPDMKVNEDRLDAEIEGICDQVEQAARDGHGIIILSDRDITLQWAPMPALMVLSSANQRLIAKGLRFRCSLIYETGQAASSHDIATMLGFGASAVCPMTVHDRVSSVFKPEEVQVGLDHYQKAVEKALLKTMGKFGLCTVESYIGGEFFESNFLDTTDPRLKDRFPNIISTVGGAGFAEIADSSARWHYQCRQIHEEKDIPNLGLFKERQEGAGHSFGTIAVREFTAMTDEKIVYSVDEEVQGIFQRYGLPLDSALEPVVSLASELLTHEATPPQIDTRLEELFGALSLEDQGQALKEVQAALKRRAAETQEDVWKRLLGGPEGEEELTPGTMKAFQRMTSDTSDPRNNAYKFAGFNKRTPEQIDRFRITGAYRHFVKSIYEERVRRPAALRDILYFPADLSSANTVEEFDAILNKHELDGNNDFCVRGFFVELAGGTPDKPTKLRVVFTSSATPQRVQNLAEHFRKRFEAESPKIDIEGKSLLISSGEKLFEYLLKVIPARESRAVEEVQPAHEITPCLSTGAMSHGALTGIVHEAVAQGANIAGALSNSGEGGERASRFDTIKSCAIKQLASGRFGVWAGYLADPGLKEVEIKIAQGAKPGEGGQLPGRKVTVEIASLRGGTPRIELVSPPPHHDTYSIEDLAQLIHDAKATRKKVVVKLVSSEGIGTIAVGVAKAGADVINVAGNSGGTGAAAVTSLKHTGRAAEIGIAEVHQALCMNGIRQKVVLRASNAHQTGWDVIKSAILGADSFEFGTTALMMLKCVMAKNCNVKCPAGLTTNPEMFQGDARALAQYFLNVAHEVRELLAWLGYRSLREIRGKTHLLHLAHHPSTVGKLNFRTLLEEVEENVPEKQVYLEADFSVDDRIIKEVTDRLIYGDEERLVLEGSAYKLSNRNKTVGGQTAIDIERILQFLLNEEHVADRRGVILQNDRGRRYLSPETLVVKTSGSAGQSYGAWLNDGMVMHHLGTCNDGIGKGMCGGVLIVQSPGGGNSNPGENVLVGNFALFGATGGRAFINGEAGDRFAVRSSGTLAVVEGVGDFACEYMTSGTVINLGTFGKGFGNGMSGGNAYQYDPHGRFDLLHNPQSIRYGNLDAPTTEAQAHAVIVKVALEEHLERTGSDRAKMILENWEESKKDFKFATPNALYETQCADEIKESMTDKAMIEELSLAEASRQLQTLGDAYTNGRSLFAGSVPAPGDWESPLIHQLVHAYSILAKATDLAQDELRRANMQPDDEMLRISIRHLIVNQDRKLLDMLSKESREVLQKLNSDELAQKLARKRVEDYKVSMKMRDVQENNSLGMTAWIMQQDQLSRSTEDTTPMMTEQLASRAAKSFVHA
ncbi:Glutamate synthase large subunit [Planctomycetales bacterium 10988]|nr:Glutamate synthase large subunit [Planctomycetales bacterium 10988]